MKMRLSFVLIFQFLFSASAFAWVDDTVAIKGTLESVNERYILLKTMDQSVIRIPKLENDDIVYGRPIILKRKLAELTEVKIIKVSPASKKTEVHMTVRTPDYKEIDSRTTQLLERLRQR